MFMFNDQQRDFISRIDCYRCHIHNECDQIKSECPKANLQTLTVDDMSILKPESMTNAKECDVAPPDFIEITKRDFEKHLYGNISRCRFKNKILSFFSSEKEAKGHPWFYFSCNGRYYRSFRDNVLTDAVPEQQIMNFLYPDNKSFSYRGWLCMYATNDGLFHLFTPSEQEQPPGMRESEFEASSPAQAIEFINCY